MGEVRLGIDIDKALDLKRRYNLNILVETGTYKGNTPLLAQPFFARIFTIEGDPNRYRKTQAGLTNPAKNITYLFGDSRTELAKVLERSGEPCLLWLDAHWCGGGAIEAHQIGDECPLREELEAVLASSCADKHVIMIDDARLFTAPPPMPHDPAQWITYEEIAALLAPRQLYIQEDVIYAEPVE